MYVRICTYIYTHTHTHIYSKNGTRKPSGFSFISLPFAHCANGSLSFVRLWTNKQMEVIRLKLD